MLFYLISRLFIGITSYVMHSMDLLNSGKSYFPFYSVIYLLLLPALDFYCATECVTD